MATTRQPKSPPKPAASERELANMERDLKTVSRRKARTKAADDEAAAERDRVIRDALAMGMPYARIIAATGLSEPRILQIRRGARI